MEKGVVKNGVDREKGRTLIVSAILPQGMDMDATTFPEGTIYVAEYETDVRNVLLSGNTVKALGSRIAFSLQNALTDIEDAAKKAEYRARIALLKSLSDDDARIYDQLALEATKADHRGDGATVISIKAKMAAMLEKAKADREGKAMETLSPVLDALLHGVKPNVTDNAEAD